MRLDAIGQRTQRRSARHRAGISERSAFSLLEVMIACGIFFMAVFAILALVSNTLRNARVLRRMEVDAGMVAAQLSKTNRMTLGTDSGDFGNLYQDYSWETYTEEVSSNGLVQVDIIVRRRGVPDPTDKMSILVYDPSVRSTGPGAGLGGAPGFGGPGGVRR